jgi:hypothetical protein
VAQVETSLCDFHSLVQGGYYLGHDIDQMQAQLLDRRVPDRTPQEVWTARAELFTSDLLGEHHGRWGVRPPLKKAYRDHGIIDWRHP